MKTYSLPLAALIMGAALFLPTSASAATYTVQPGDWLSKIAQRFGLSWQELHRANPQISNPHLIFPGQVLTTPDPGTAPAAPSAPPVVASAPPPAPSVQPSGPDAWDGLLQQHFGAEWQFAKKVMICESGGNPYAHNPHGPDDSWGLFQINRRGDLAASRPSPSWLMVGANNIAYAAEMRSREGWTPWACAR